MSLTMFLLIRVFGAKLAQHTKSGAGGAFGRASSAPEEQSKEDQAGAIHWYLALTLMALVAIHALAALKHHFIDGDRTLIKMVTTPSPPFAKGGQGEFQQH